MRTVWRAALDGMTPYDAGKPLAELAAELGLPELVRLSANENPLGQAELGRELGEGLPGVVRGHPVEDRAPDGSHGPILVSLRRI